MNSAFYFVANVIQSLGWLVLSVTALTVLFRMGDWFLSLVRGVAPDRAEHSKSRSAPRAQKAPAARKRDRDVIEVEMRETNGRSPVEIGGPSGASEPKALPSPRKRTRGSAKPQDLAERICPNCDASLIDAVKDAQGVGYRCVSCNQRVV